MTEEEIKMLRTENEKCLLSGKFVMAFPKIPTDKGDNSIVFIKLSEIKSVENLWTFENDGEDGCFFNTYKDHQYFTFLKARKLVELINELEYGVSHEQR